jgi:hypothetical protein
MEQLLPLKNSRKLGWQGDIAVTRMPKITTALPLEQVTIKRSTRCQQGIQVVVLLHFAENQSPVVDQAAGVHRQNKTKGLPST